MADYAIGDVQGCYDALQRLLEAIDFNENRDQLCFVGDLVNRGPESLAVLRFIRSLPIAAKITLGNHDLHLLARLFCDTMPRKDDTLAEVILADDAQELGHWLRKQSILVYCPNFNVLLCHAGISPLWDLNLASRLAKELEAVLSGENYQTFLSQMYGNKPYKWYDAIEGMDRLRLITNYFTRMRFCHADGSLDLAYKGTIAQASAQLYPWYEVPGRLEIDADIIFGHWASLMGQCTRPRIYPIDYGCLWGGKLAALRLEDKQLFTVSCAV